MSPELYRKSWLLNEVVPDFDTEVSFAVQIGEYAHLGPQNFRHDRDRNVVDPTFISLQTVEIGQMDGRDGDDRDLLEARMLPNHCGQVEAVEI